MEHIILGLLLLIQTGFLVAGLRMLLIMSRESASSRAHAIWRKDTPVSCEGRDIN